MHPLADLGYLIVGELVAAAIAHEEIGKAVGGGQCGAASGSAELAGIGVDAVQRVGILDFDIDGLEFVTGLERMAAQKMGDGRAKVPDLRVLVLGVGGLAAEGAPAGDGLGVEAAGEVRGGGKAGDAEEGLEAGAADGEGLLAGLSEGVREARFRDGAGAEDGGHGAEALIEQDVVAAFAGIGGF